MAAAHIAAVVVLGHIGLRALVGQRRGAVASQVVETVHAEQVDRLGAIVAGNVDYRLLDALAQVVTNDTHHLALRIAFTYLAEQFDVSLAESPVRQGVNGAARLGGIGRGIDGSHNSIRRLGTTVNIGRVIADFHAGGQRIGIVGPVVRTAVNQDDIRTSHTAALRKAGREVFLEPGVGGRTIFGFVVGIGRVGYRGTGEGDVGIELTVFHIIVHKTIPIRLTDQRERPVGCRIVSGIAAGNPSLESRDGVSDYAQAFCRLGLDMRIGGKAFDGRETVGAGNPGGPVGRCLQFGKERAVGKLGRGQGLVAALGSLALGRADLLHRLIPETVADRGWLGAAGIDRTEKAISANIRHLFTAVENSRRRYGGVAVLVEVLTDNKNRAAANVRNIFNKNGGNLGTTGSVARMFDRKGVIEYDAEKVSEDEVMEVALEAGADDIVNEDGVITVTTDPSKFTEILEVLQGKEWESLSAGVDMVPQAYTAVDAETAKKVAKLLNKLEEDDDVQNVYSTVEYPDGFDPDAE